MQVNRTILIAKLLRCDFTIRMELMFLINPFPLKRCRRDTEVDGQHLVDVIHDGIFVHLDSIRRLAILHL